MSPFDRISRSRQYIRGSAAAPVGQGASVSSVASNPVSVSVSGDVGGTFNTQVTALLVLLLAGLVLLGRVSLR